MLDFEEFKNEVVDNIKDFLPQEYAEAEVKLNQTMKNNDVELSSLTVRMEGETVVPNIYLENFYDKYQDTGDLQNIMKDIADIAENAKPQQEFELGKLQSFEVAKDSIFPKLVNAEMNAENLTHMPHKMMDDLAVTYAVMMHQDEGGRASVAITNDMLETFGINEDKLHEVALSNMDTLTPSKFESFRDVVAATMIEQMTEVFGGDREAATEMVNEMLGSTPADMYIVTNEEGINGAVNMLDEKLMNDIAEKIGEDFKVIPSSVHECLIVPESAGMEIDELKEMVSSVNQDAVSPQERLSDNVYCYDFKEHELVRAETMEERKMERETQRKEPEKGAQKDTEKKESSLSDRIAGKKKQIEDKQVHEPKKGHEKNKDTSL